MHALDCMPLHLHKVVGVVFLYCKIYIVLCEWFACLGSKSVEYSQKTMEEAVKAVEKMSANLGGTEILRPLTEIYRQACIPSQPRQVKAKTGDSTNVWEMKRSICFCI